MSIKCSDSVHRLGLPSDSRSQLLFITIKKKSVASRYSTLLPSNWDLQLELLLPTMFEILYDSRGWAALPRGRSGMAPFWGRGLIPEPFSSGSLFIIQSLSGCMSCVQPREGKEGSRAQCFTINLAISWSGGEWADHKQGVETHMHVRCSNNQHKMTDDVVQKHL